jgi:hypothetical protein
MEIDQSGHEVPEATPARYGTSKLTFRGPARDLSGAYVACLGGTETRGKFIDKPFPALLEEDLGLPCVNFGWPNAGPDVILNDAGLLGLAGGARAVVLQTLPAMNLSNPYYTVHPRRNDRFLSGTDRLRRLYPEVDFTEFHFTRHMMRRLSTLCPVRFADLRQALQEVWVTRMETLLARLEPPVVLLWLADHPPGDGTGSADVSDDPAFVSRAMIEALAPGTERVVEVMTASRTQAQARRRTGMSRIAQSAVAQLPGPQAHDATANALLPVLREILAQ